MHYTNFASFSGILARTEIFRDNQRGLLRIKRGYLIRLRLNKGTKSTLEPVKAVEYGVDALSTYFLMGGKDLGYDGVKNLFKWDHETWIKNVTQSNDLLIKNGLMSASDFKPGLIRRLQAYSNPVNWDQSRFHRLCNFDFSVEKEIDNNELKLVFISKDKGTRAELIRYVKLKLKSIDFGLAFLSQGTCQINL